MKRYKTPKFHAVLACGLALAALFVESVLEDELEAVRASVDSYRIESKLNSIGWVTADIRTRQPGYEGFAMSQTDIKSHLQTLARTDDTSKIDALYFYVRCVRIVLNVSSCFFIFISVLLSKDQE